MSKPLGFFVFLVFPFLIFYFQYHKLIISNICQVLKCFLLYFRHLDISQPTEKHGKFVDENQTLLHLVQSLPNLESLDISGTNLAGTGEFTSHSNSQNLNMIAVQVLL